MTAMAATISPSTDDLRQMMRTRTTAQLITDHALTDAMSCVPGIDDREASALIIALASIEAVLTERGIHTCPDCGTPSDQHADFCREH